MTISMKRDAAVLEGLTSGFPLGPHRPAWDSPTGVLGRPSDGHHGVSPLSIPSVQGPTTLLRHLFIWISVGVITKEGALRETPQSTMNGFIRPRLSFDFLDYHT